MGGAAPPRPVWGSRSPGFDRGASPVSSHKGRRLRWRTLVKKSVTQAGHLTLIEHHSAVDPELADSGNRWTPTSTCDKPGGCDAGHTPTGTRHDRRAKDLHRANQEGRVGKTTNAPSNSGHRTARANSGREGARDRCRSFRSPGQRRQHGPPGFGPRGNSAARTSVLPNLLDGCEGQSACIGCPNRVPASSPIVPIATLDLLGLENGHRPPRPIPPRASWRRRKGRSREADQASTSSR